MAITSWSTCRVYGTWTDAEGNRLPGTVSTLISARVTNTQDDLIIPAGAYKPGVGVLNTVDTSKASLDFVAPATDDPDIPETGWVVKVTVTFDDRSIQGETYILDTLPSGGVVDLRTIIPATSGTMNFGPAGIKLGIAGGVALFDENLNVVDANGNPITMAVAPSTTDVVAAAV